MKDSFTDSVGFGCSTKTIRSELGFDFKKDWFQELNKNEILKKDGREFVFLHGLDRLAKERGIRSTRSKVVQTPTRECPCAVVSYTYSFYDGGSFEASADASTTNTDKGFNRFLTAMAESRARARALRVAFGISACSVEEISNNPAPEEEVDDYSVPANDTQKHLIRHLSDKNNVSDIESIVSVDKLSRGEATEVINILNGARPTSKLKKRFLETK